MGRVTHFEIHADQPERAVVFYRAVFGWEINKWAGPGEYWLIKTGPDSAPGINGGLLKRPVGIGGKGLNAFCCTVDVAQVDESVSRALAAGGAIAMAKMAVPGIGWLAYCLDTEGNTFGMMQRDPQAK